MNKKARRPYRTQGDATAWTSLDPGLRAGLEAEGIHGPADWRSLTLQHKTSAMCAVLNAATPNPFVVGLVQRCDDAATGTPWVPDPEVQEAVDTVLAGIKEAGSLDEFRNRLDPEAVAKFDEVWRALTDWFVGDESTTTH